MKWIVADATEWQPPETYDVWHDRAAFHVLTDEKEQNAYIQRLKQALLRGGHVITGTFAPDGPEKCSFSAQTLFWSIAAAMSMQRHDKLFRSSSSALSGALP